MLVHRNQCTKSRIIPLCWFALHPPFGTIYYLNHLCWALNHQNTYKWPKGTFPFQSPPFWWFMPTQQKATHRSATSMQMRSRFVFDSNLAYLDHSLPPLGLFLQIKLNFLSLSQTHLLRHKERYSKSNWSKIKKTPPFSHNQTFFPQETNFWQKETLRVFWQIKTSNSTIFKILKW
jgi:hypothetical protein